MYTVYILKSSRFHRHYIGYTDNLERRIKEHNSGKTKSLLKYIPMRIIYTEKYETQLDAMRRELQIKSYKGGKAFKSLLGLTRS